jgi:beta-lactamase regulating signal transducer with metallopeptidase domain
MSFDSLPMHALRVGVLLACTLGAMPLLAHASSATRRLVLVLALAGALVLPVVSGHGPRWRLDTPVAVSSFRGFTLPEPLVEPVQVNVTPAPMAPAAASARDSGLRRIDPVLALWALWTAGALVVLARLGLGLVRSRAIWKRSIEASGWTRAAARAATRTGLRVPVRMTSELEAPAVTGMFKPVILVPERSTLWSDDMKYAVLLHELAHVRQRDCLAYLVSQLVGSVHWFDPLAWKVIRRLRLECELAADDAVILGGARASSYAEDLLVLAGALNRPVPSGALAMAEPSQITARVLAIVSGNRTRRPPGRVSKVLLAAALSGGLLAIAGTTPAVPGGAPARDEGAPSTGVPPAGSASPTAESTLDPRLQTIADQELERAMREWSPAAGVVLVLDPSTGEILADAGRREGAPADVAAGSALLTGSTLKAVTLAAALEERVLSPTESIDCEQGRWVYKGETFKDAQPYGLLTVTEMLAVSSNIGLVKIFDRLGQSRLDHWLRAFHFDGVPAVEGAPAGAPTGAAVDRSSLGAITAIGEKMTASPMQVAAAYAALANKGVFVPPTRTRRTGKVPHETLVRPETAQAVVAMLETAVNGEKATGSRARIDGPRVAGKTGTAAWTRPDGSTGIYASFVGFVPSTAPRFVILVGLEQPRNGEAGGKVAAPVFARVATRALLAPSRPAGQ